MSDPRAELEQLRRLAELEAKAGGSQPSAAPDFSNVSRPDGSQYDPYNPTVGMSGFDKFAAGAGKTISDLGIGIKQRLGFANEEDVAKVRERDAPLMDTGAGKAGSIAGAVAAFAPTAFIPGANTYTGAALGGAVFGALQPTVEGESAVKNTALGGALGLAGQYGGNKLAQALSKKINAGKVAQIANQGSDDVLKQSIDAGYKIPPSYARGGTAARLAEGLSGKYKTNQLAGIKNQSVTNKLAKEALGIPDNVPLSRDVIKNVRSAAFKSGYEPVTKAGRVITDPQFSTALDDAARAFSDVANDFPELVDDQIIKTIDGLRKDSFDSNSAVSAIRLLRDKASSFYRAGSSAQGKAARDAAQAVEDQLERHLTGLGDDGAALLANFRNARQMIAKAHSVEGALKGSGNVNAAKLGAMIEKGSPLTGELEKIAKFGAEFGDVARVPKSGDANPLTAVDFGFGGIGLGGAVASGNPAVAAMIPAAMASRYGARQAILSGPVQRAMASKSYDPSMLAKALGSRPAQAITRAAPLAALPAN